MEFKRKCLRPCTPQLGIRFSQKECRNNITNCTFGGQNNSELFVTTAIKGMSKADIRKFSYSGHLFSVKTNTKGIFQKKFVFKNEKKRSLL